MKTVVNIILSLALLAVIVLNGSNIAIQLQTVGEARRKNTEVSERIRLLEEENRQLVRKIEWATSSAYINQQARDKLGLGTADDYWLILPQETGPEVNLGTKAEIGEKMPNWKQWFLLFTGKPVVLK